MSQSRLLPWSHPCLIPWIHIRVNLRLVRVTPRRMMRRRCVITRWIFWSHHHMTTLSSTGQNLRPKDPLLCWHHDIGRVSIFMLDIFFLLRLPFPVRYQPHFHNSLTAFITLFLNPHENKRDLELIHHKIYSVSNPVTL